MSVVIFGGIFQMYLLHLHELTNQSETAATGWTPPGWAPTSDGEEGGVLVTERP